MDIATASALCRFARDAAALMLWGGCLYVAALAPRGVRQILGERCRPWLRAAVLALVVAVLALLPVQVAALGEGWRDAVDPNLTRALLFETSIGTAWLAQSAAMMVMLVAVAASRPWSQAATASASALLLASVTLTGHAAMHEGLLGLAHRANDLLHLLAAGFWLGALMPLLPTLALLGDRDRHGDAVVALRRFSTLGHGAVALVIATGVLNTALVLGRWPTDWASPYQRLLAAKVGLVAVMTVLAVLNRYLFVPRLPSAPASSLHRIRLATLAEVALGLGAVALVAIFGQMEPA